jgi:uncharacterized membrane protein YqhA
MSFVRQFHVFIIGVLFLYVGIKRGDIPKPEITFKVLLGLGAVVTAFHMYRATTKDSIGAAWVNLIHVLLVGPLLMFIGWNGAETPRRFFELLMMLGFAAIGYHGYYMLS